MARHLRISDTLKFEIAKELGALEFEKINRFGNILSRNSNNIIINAINNSEHLKNQEAK